MKIAIAPNSFKGTLTAAQAAACIERGLKKALPDLVAIQIPMADGGDGTLQAIVDATGGRTVKCTVSDPLGRPIPSVVGITLPWPDGGDRDGTGQRAGPAQALASAAAAHHFPGGMGELIRAALDQQVPGDHPRRWRQRHQRWRDGPGPRAGGPIFRRARPEAARPRRRVDPAGPH